MPTLTMYFECKHFSEIHSKTKHLVIDNAVQEQIDYQIKLCGREIKFISISYADDSQVDKYGVQHILNLLKFLMIFYGSFPQIISIIAMNDIPYDVTEELRPYLIKCFKTDKSFTHSAFYFNSINNYENNQLAQLYSNWLSIKDKLELTHNLFLYSISEVWPLIDMRNIILIQVLGPLYEIIPKNEANHCTLIETLALAEEIIGGTDYPKLGNKNTKAYRLELIKQILRNNKGSHLHISLRQKLHYIILKNGSVIFQKEIKENKLEKMLTLFVNSRNRIAHIIPNINAKDFLSGSQCYPYNLKLYFLYRVILMSLIGVPEDCYISCLISAIREIDKLEDIL